MQIGSLIERLRNMDCEVLADRLEVGYEVPCGIVIESGCWLVTKANGVTLHDYYPSICDWRYCYGGGVEVTLKPSELEKATDETIRELEGMLESELNYPLLSDTVYSQLQNSIIDDTVGYLEEDGLLSSEREKELAREFLYSCSPKVNTIDFSGGDLWNYVEENK